MVVTAQSQGPEGFSGHLRAEVRYTWQAHFRDFCPVDHWTPPINVYCSASRFDLCVELAGIDTGSIDVHIEPHRVIIRGVRTAPEPSRRPDRGMRIVAMEIDHGPFCRTVVLPEAINPRRSRSEYRDGLLWVHLPIQSGR